MALPQLAGAGNNNSPMLKDAFSQQDQHGDLLASLVDLTKELIDGQAKLFEKLLLSMDKKDEDTPVDSASGSVEAVEEEMTLGVKDLFAGAFIALTLWANDLDKYIRTLWLAKTLASLAKIPDSIKAVFTTLGTKIKNSKFLKTLITPITTFFDDVVRGFKSVDGTMTKARNSLGQFRKTSKAAENIGEFAKTVKAAFTKVMDFLKPIGNVFKSLSGLGGIGKTIKPFVDMFKKVLPTLKGIVSKVLLPLFVIFDFVSGFIEGFSSKGEDDERGLLEKTFDGVVAGLLEVVKGIFIVPLDLIKSFISTIAGALGFKDIEKRLDSFKFADMFDDLVKKIKDIMEFIKKLIMNPIDTIKSAFNSFFADDADDPNEESKKIEAQIAEEQARIDRSKAGVNEYSKFEIGNLLGDENKGIEISQRKIEQLQRDLNEAKTKEEVALKAGPMQELPKPQGLGEEGKQLAQTTQEVATEKEKQNKGQAAPVVIQAGNGDTINNNSGTTLLGPSLRSMPDPNWMYDE
jgi:hypothetical protein